MRIKRNRRATQWRAYSFFYRAKSCLTRVRVKMLPGGGKKGHVGNEKKTSEKI